MTINDFNNLRLHYCLGADVAIFSLSDSTDNRNILTNKNVTVVGIEYIYDDVIYTYEKPLDFHINSCILIITNLPSEKNIQFIPYITYKKNNKEVYKVQLTDPINETTLPYGNISYDLIESNDTSNDNVVKLKIEEILRYINGFGSYTTNEQARVIPIRYNSSVQTAQATYYKNVKRINNEDKYGLVETSGGPYATNHTMFHELRHRFGINTYTDIFYRSWEEGRCALFDYISDDFSLIHEAMKFHTSKDDAKVWIWYAHSNIPEARDLDEGDLNYISALYEKALIWYSYHDVDEDTEPCKINIEAVISPTVLKGKLDEEPTEPEEPEEDDPRKMYLSTLIKPYFIDTTTKVYLKGDKYNNDFLNKSFNITLYPYSDIVNNVYNINNDLSSTTITINDERFYFNLVSKLGFVDGHISLINNFMFPGKLEEKTHYETVEEAEAYEQIINSQIKQYYNSYYVYENIESYERDSYLDEIDIEEIRSTGFYIQFANDVNFNEIVYESKINIDAENDNFIYDFSFSLNNLFESWDQLNEILVLRTTFIDKRLGIYIRGNNVVLTKEWFKYLINDTIDGQVIYGQQNNLIDNNFDIPCSSIVTP